MIGVGLFVTGIVVGIAMASAHYRVLLRDAIDLLERAVAGWTATSNDFDRLQERVVANDPWS